ncbi:hypothetical protein TWF694_010490 [Orbilia ellipsospora]|uniref:Uncharacterized protein n=1 Tax=Orbilia ellipsospora TaxID=2528407 RepID=A0AAV9XAY9_9PEZI
MTRPQRERQTRLADPHLSYKSVRFGGIPSTPRPSNRDEQSTLSQFGFTPSSSSTTKKKKKRTLIPYTKRNLKRKSLDLDDLKNGTPEREDEEEEEDGSPTEKKKRRLSARIVKDESDEDDDVIKEEVNEGKFLVSDESEKEDDEESWRPILAPKRRRGRTTAKPKRNSRLAKPDRTLTQMYPLDHPISDSEYEEEEEHGNREESSEGEVIKEEPIEEPEEMRIKDEPNSQNEILLDLGYNDDEYIKQEDDRDTHPVKREEAEKENIPSEDEQTSILASSANPQTPHKPIRTVVPSSYTPPMTPLSPLRHKQLDAIYKSPSVQRLWRLKGVAMPGLSPVVEDATKEKAGSAMENNEPETISPSTNLKKPNFTREDTHAESSIESSSKNETQSIPSFIRNRVVPSSQWWDREESWVLNSGKGLETVLEVDSQPEVQVESSDVPEVRSATATPKADRIINQEDVEVIPESPLRPRAEISRKNQAVPTEFREPLLRDSSGLHTLYSTSFFRRESSAIVPPPKITEHESQKSEVSTRSVDRQLLLESDEYSKLAIDRVEETPIEEKQNSDPDATISQSPSKDTETTPRPKSRTRSLATRKDSRLPLLPPSSPPQSYSNIPHISETPRSSKDIFHSPSSKISTSPTVEFTKRSSESYGFRNQDSEDLNEAGDSMEPNRRGSSETLSQWRLRTFGPSQAVPTISQFFPQGLLGDSLDDDDDDDDEEL